MLGFCSPRCIKSPEEFLQILKRKRVCADGYINDFSIAFFYLENRDSSHAPVRNLSCVIARRVGYTDQVGCFDKRSFTVLLPDTSVQI